MAIPLPNQNFLAYRSGRVSDGRDVYGTLCPDQPAAGSLHLARFSGNAHARPVYALGEAPCSIDSGELLSARFTGRLVGGLAVYAAYHCPCIVTSSSNVAGCICMQTLHDMGWPNLLVTMRSNAEIGCPDCFPQERTYYWNGPPAGAIGSGWYVDPQPGQPGIPPDCDPITGSLVGHIDCGREPAHCDPPCSVDEGNDEKFMASIVCGAQSGQPFGNCYRGRLEVLACEPFLLRGIKICCPGGTRSGCCGEGQPPAGETPLGCIDVEVTLAP